MRRWFLVFCSSLLSLTALGAPSPNSQPKTIEGCVISINGAFRLNLPNGQSYILQGDHSNLFSYNGMQVQVTGTVKKPSNSSASSGLPQTLKVSGIKKTHDTCQF